MNEVRDFLLVMWPLVILWPASLWIAYVMGKRRSAALFSQERDDSVLAATLVQEAAARGAAQAAAVSRAALIGQDPKRSFIPPRDPNGADL